MLSSKSHLDIWQSTEVVVTQGREASKGKLVLVFKADNGKPTGDVWFGVERDESMVRTARLNVFELVERDGKQFIEVYKMKDPGGTKPGREKGPWMTLAYSIKGGDLVIKSTAKGGREGEWAGFEVLLGETTTFKKWKPE